MNDFSTKLWFSLVWIGLLSLDAASAVRWSVQGLGDATLWKTEAGPALVGRNDGSSTGEGRLRLWTVAEFHPRVRAVAQGTIGAATDIDGSEADWVQALVHVDLRKDQRLQLEVGQLVQPVGNFSERYLASSNPLIGEPLAYGTRYPLGVQLSGAFSVVDFRAALVDLPTTHEHFFPEPDSDLRPALALGVTPFTGLRVGLYHTEGSYLNDEIEDRLDAGLVFGDLEQRISGVDLRFSRGHFELHADWNDVAYDVPPSGGRHHGESWFLEPRYTWSPRWYTALRYEHSRYVGVSWTGSSWLVKKPTFEVAEAGAGFRLSRATTIKGSIAKEIWSIPQFLKTHYPDGYAGRLQLVHRFDVLEWFDR